MCNFVCILYAICICIHTFSGFDEAIVGQLARDTGLPFKPAANKFESISAHDALVHAHGALNTAATSLMKVAKHISIMMSIL